MFRKTSKKFVSFWFRVARLLQGSKLEENREKSQKIDDFSRRWRTSFFENYIFCSCEISKTT